MKKLSKEQKATMDDLLEKLKEKAEAVTSEEERVNGAIGDLNTAIEAYNDVVGELEGFRDEVVGAMEEYEGERSEKWADSDAGQDFSSWKSEWENLDCEEVETVEELEERTMNHGDELENLPTEAG